MTAKLIKIDRNGSKHYEGWIKCDRCGGRGLFATAVVNGQPRITPVDGGICHKCLGKGKVWGKWIERTPEYEAKLAEKRAQRAEAKAAEQEAKANAEREANHAKSLEVMGFSPDGKTFLVLGDTYSRKDEIKAAGGKFDISLGWHFPHPVEGFETVETDEATVATVDYWGRIRITIARSEADALKEAANAKLHPSNSGHIGTVGERLTVTAKYIRSASWEVNYGNKGGKGWWGYLSEQTQYLHTFEDESGNVLVWKTTSPIAREVGDHYIDVNKGETVTVKGTVKEHGEYKGIKQTVLTRCKIS